LLPTQVRRLCGVPTDASLPFHACPRTALPPPQMDLQSRRASIAKAMAYVLSPRLAVARGSSSPSVLVPVSLMPTRPGLRRATPLLSTVCRRRAAAAAATYWWTQQRGQPEHACLCLRPHRLAVAAAVPPWEQVLGRRTADSCSLRRG